MKNSAGRIMGFVSLSLALLAPALGGEYRVAFLAASSQNGFNQAVFDGIKKRAAEIGGVSVEIFDGEFNASKQYAQVEDIATSGKFDALIIVPNDSVGIATAVKDATATGLKVATALFPIGPKLDTLEPQIAGLTATVASNPSVGAALAADGVIKYCADKDPCNVVIIIGQKIYPFDNLRYQTYVSMLGAHPNIKVVASIEGNYDPDKAMAGMEDVLQANDHIDVILSNADQHMVGAEIALEAAGIDMRPLYTSAGGGSQIAITAIREGRWDATVAEFPVTMGMRALDAVVDALSGKQVDPVVDSNAIGPVPSLVNREVLDAHPEFKGEFLG